MKGKKMFFKCNLLTKSVLPVFLLFVVFPLKAESYFIETEDRNPIKLQSAGVFEAEGIYLSQLPKNYNNNKYKASKKKYSKGDVVLPSGIRLAYMLAIPYTAPVKNIYTDLHGGDLTYTYFFNNYVSIKTGISSVVGMKPALNSYTLQSSLSIGLNFGFPVIGFIYPYIGVSAKGIWLHEQADTIIRDFGGIGPDGNIGIAFTLANVFGLYIEYVIGWAVALDKSYTDISTMSVKAGFYFRF